MSDEILFRLMKKLPDGSFKVVGYQMHKHFNDEFGIRIYHEHATETIKGTNMQTGSQGWYDIINQSHMAVIYDRIDRYTGIELDGVKVFERDQGLLNGHVFGDSLVTVIYKAPSFQVQHADGILYDLNDYFYKLTGIEGVTP